MEILEDRHKTIKTKSGKSTTLGRLFYGAIEDFEIWWENKYFKFEKENKLIYSRYKTRKVLSRERTKYIAALEPDEYKEFLKEYKQTIKDLKATIPPKYRSKLKLEKNFKFLNTSSFTLKISKNCIKIPEYNNTTYEEMLDIIDKNIGDVFDGMTKKQIKELPEDELKALKEENKRRKKEKRLRKNKLEVGKEYDIKTITGDRYQINYYDIDKGKSLHTGLGDAIFVPIGAEMHQPKQRQTRKDKQERLFTLTNKGGGLNYVVESRELKAEKKKIEIIPSSSKPEKEKLQQEKTEQPDNKEK